MGYFLVSVLFKMLHEQRRYEHLNLSIVVGQVSLDWKQAYSTLCLKTPWLDNNSVFTAGPGGLQHQVHRAAFIGVPIRYNLRGNERARLGVEGKRRSR